MPQRGIKFERAAAAAGRYSRHSLSVRGASSFATLRRIHSIRGINRTIRKNSMRIKHNCATNAAWRRLAQATTPFDAADCRQQDPKEIAPRFAQNSPI